MTTKSRPIAGDRARPGPARRNRRVPAVEERQLLVDRALQIGGPRRRPSWSRSRSPMPSSPAGGTGPLIVPCSSQAVPHFRTGPWVR